MQIKGTSEQLRKLHKSRANGCSIYTTTEILLTNTVWLPVSSVRWRERGLKNAKYSISLYFFTFSSQQIFTKNVFQRKWWRICVTRPMQRRLLHIAVNIDSHHRPDAIALATATIKYSTGWATIPFSSYLDDFQIFFQLTNYSTSHFCCCYYYCSHTVSSVYRTTSDNHVTNPKHRATRM